MGTTLGKTARYQQAEIGYVVPVPDTLYGVLEWSQCHAFDGLDRLRDLLVTVGSRSRLAAVGRSDAMPTMRHVSADLVESLHMLLADAAREAVIYHDPESETAPPVWASGPAWERAHIELDAVYQRALELSWRQACHDRNAAA